MKIPSGLVHLRTGSVFLSSSSLGLGDFKCNERLQALRLSKLLLALGKPINIMLSLSICSTWNCGMARSERSHMRPITFFVA